MITRSTLDMKNRLADAEDRLLAARRRGAATVVIENLSSEVNDLRNALWRVRRERHLAMQTD
jgi:hypothetical protein